MNFGLKLCSLLILAVLLVDCNDSIPGSLCPQHIGPPCPRYYKNPYADYQPGDSVAELLDSIRSNMTDKLDEYLDILISNAPPHIVGNVPDDVFTGAAGRALLMLKLYLRSGSSFTSPSSSRNSTLLELAGAYAETALDNMTPEDKGISGFLKGSPGMWTVAAVTYAMMGNTSQSEYYIQLVNERLESYQTITESTYDTGLAGLMMCVRFLWEHIPSSRDILSEAQLHAVAVEVMERGIVEGEKKGLPTGVLIWPNEVFPDIVFYATGHGQSGILWQYLHIPSVLQNETMMQHVWKTMDWLGNLQLPSGNFPTPRIPPYPLESDVLVQWCHGSPGFIALFGRASIVASSSSDEVIKAKAAAYEAIARKAADNVWTVGLLTKGLMLGHGISGNSYMQIYLGKILKDDRYLYRAVQHQRFVLNTPIVSDPAIMRVPTPNPYMPFTGSYAGAIALWQDMLFDIQGASMLGFETAL